MRLNLPVTNTEYPIDDDTLIVSTTDTKGRITYINSTFVEVSGFSEEELIGKAHNIVRHPDVPPEAFEDLWATLKQGLPWTGLVKNRRKNGDFYWINANATPLIENGQITGYLSVRTKASQTAIEQAAPAYQQILEGKAKNLKIEKGQIVRTDFIGKLQSFLKMTTRKRIAFAMTIPALFLLAVGGIGWWGLSQTQAPASLSSMIATITAAGIALIAYLAYGMVKNTLTPLQQAIDIANKLAGGDLTHKFSVNRSDEFGELLKALSQMGVNLRATVLDVQKNAASVRLATGEIASGNLDLSQRTEEQASSLEETASSMEELTATVRQNTDNSINANQIAMTASNITTKGGEMMQEVVTTMSSISESSSKIADIISVIDGIAFQTNILALNAAVEAARAGEQGRGFAVVATEVRNLAQRSATAAKEIKTLIDDSVKKVDQGAALVNETGKTMNEIVMAIKNLTEIMSDITSASKEQNTGIEQVTQAVSQMDEVTQQNAALVEQAAAAAASLEQQAYELVGAISIFHLSQSSSKRPANVAQLADKNSTEHDGLTGHATRSKSQRRAKIAVGDHNNQWSEF
ncbi:methyl-accepting chemotaxis protein [Nitrosomonas oligotropha]|uniref:Methyl-accepting chemotaxis sensory transducer with Pas/Pac sensor n=1 Tax=Nitrosomonas oligotropha TaxID=42354 RepID=A0A1H8TW96_9PROT|nr:PAS domain-containing methyl-accepting chemotaxis protein [Nitrosomonas oligotropha]SDX36624.1 methyl-accepting chemotaxis sensory transducer with Pas/Pac sensor [Nitrosomonas oligotropha]SEO95167.1 methyl-accepting chemotaxis sensory transducer with Pas/Pac sensor [Nitrosomonas oligotropha]